jgi:hypothetical protein
MNLKVCYHRLIITKMINPEILTTTKLSFSY